MNKNRHRIIFNAARGQRMVVAESASSVSGGSASGETSAPSGAVASLVDLELCPSNRLRRLALRPLTLSLGLAVTLGLVLYTSAHAQIVADPSAPGNQRPIVLQTANGTPLVQIRTPSAAGVSRNTFSAFDIQGNGVVLNNVRANSAPTQIGGYVQANPFLGAVAASVPARATSAATSPAWASSPASRPAMAASR